MNLEKILTNGNPAKAFVLNPANNTYTPVNLVPTVLTKCLNCNLYYPISEIEQHLKTHSRNSATTRRHLPEIAVVEEVVEAKSNQIEDIKLDQIVRSNLLKMPDAITDIKTMNPDEIPCVETVRKAVELPKPIRLTDSTVENGNSFLSQLLPDVMAQADQEILPIVPNENIGQEDAYFQNMEINQNIVQLQKKQISKYSYSCFANRQRDDYVDSRKVPNYSSCGTPHPPKYTIQSVVEPVKRSSKMITVNDCSRLQTQENSFMVTNKHNSCGNQCRSSERKSQSLIVGACPDPRNCACPGCGGFYCPVCKSTVPPQYRLPPGYKIVKDQIPHYLDDINDITRKPTQSQF